jgi:hypothetical protein
VDGREPAEGSTKLLDGSELDRKELAEDSMKLLDGREQADH